MFLAKPIMRRGGGTLLITTQDVSQMTCIIVVVCILSHIHACCSLQTVCNACLAFCSRHAFLYVHACLSLHSA